MSLNAQRTVAQALAPSVSQEDWEEFVVRTLAEAEPLEQHSQQLAADASALLKRCLVAAGVSTWPRGAK